MSFHPNNEIKRAVVTTLDLWDSDGTAWLVILMGHFSAKTLTLAHRGSKAKTDRRQLRILT